MNKSSKIALYTSLAITVASFIGWHVFSLMNVEKNNSVEAKRRKKKRKAFPGLINYGNTCFMNVILQSLAGQPSFMKFVTNKSEKKEKNLLSNTLSEIMDVLNNGTDDTTYDPTHLLADLSTRGWRILYDEHDAHEFFLVIMTTLDEEAKHRNRKMMMCTLSELEKITRNYNQTDYKAVFQCNKKLNKLRNDTTMPECWGGLAQSRMFHGTLSTRLRCCSCSQQNPVTYESFDSLSMPITTTWQSSIILKDCLKSFFSKEMVHEVHCINCSQLINGSTRKLMTPDANQNVRPQAQSTPKQDIYPSETLTTNMILSKIQSPKKKVAGRNLDKMVKMTKSSFYKESHIAKMPQCLCIHLKRLVWCGGMPMKHNHFVEFPEILDLSPYTFTYPQHIDHLGDALKQKTKSENKVAISRTLSQSDIVSKMENKNFELTLKGGCQLVPKLTRPSLYQLTSVVIHLGDWNCNGHYVSYRRVTSVEEGQPIHKWFFTSDTFVRQASLQEVLLCPAYLLFYEKL